MKFEATLCSSSTRARSWMRGTRSAMPSSTRARRMRWTQRRSSSSLRRDPSRSRYVRPDQAEFRRGGGAHWGVTSWGRQGRRGVAACTRGRLKRDAAAAAADALELQESGRWRRTAPRGAGQGVRLPPDSATRRGLEAKSAAGPPADTRYPTAERQRGLGAMRTPSAPARKHEPQNALDRGSILALPQGGRGRPQRRTLLD